MNDIKNLKKLADACRKAGIKSFKNAEFEFTLSDDVPLSSYKKRMITKQPKLEDSSVPVADLITDSLTQEQLLLWSTGSADGEPNENN